MDFADPIRYSPKMKIAAIQMCSNDQLADNLRQAERLIKTAVTQGAQLLVLPENFAIMSQDPAAKIHIAEEFGFGPIQDFLAEQAKKHQIYLVGGTIPIKSAQENKVTATCLMMNDQGLTIARYDKIHLFDVTLSASEQYHESASISAGNQIAIIDTPFAKIGMVICYDIRFPELFITMREQAVDIIAIPTAFTVPTGKAHWETLLRARAMDTLSYVIGACQGGEHPGGRQTYGHSMIIHPWGSILAGLNHAIPGVIVCDFDKQELEKCRRMLPIHQHGLMTRS